MMEDNLDFSNEVSENQNFASEQALLNIDGEAFIKYDEKRSEIEKKNPKKPYKKDPYVNELNPMPTVIDKDYKSEQNIHSKTASFHQGKKPFKCEICLTAFKQKNHLSRHIITGKFF